MNYWKYKILYLHYDLDKDWEGKLNETASEGWELMLSTLRGNGERFLFKKPDIERDMEARLNQMRFKAECDKIAHGWLDGPKAGSPPSSDDKSPHNATGEANRGTQEFEPGDRVQFNASEGPSLMVATQGVISCIYGDGVAQIRAEGSGFFLRHISVLKNLSRP